jgi:hypothetical protein
MEKTTKLTNNWVKTSQQQGVVEDQFKQKNVA